MSHQRIQFKLIEYYVNAFGNLVLEGEKMDNYENTIDIVLVKEDCIKLEKILKDFIKEKEK